MLHIDKHRYYVRGEPWKVPFTVEPTLVSGASVALTHLLCVLNVLAERYHSA